MEPITQLLEAIQRGDCSGLEGVFAEEATLDSTVPNWRSVAHGRPAVLAELASLYRHAGTFDTLERKSLPDGELVVFLLTWEENGIPQAVHQAHILTVQGDRIDKGVIFCGGRWSAALLAEMGAAGISTPPRGIA